MVFKKLQSYKTENNLVIAFTADAMTIDIQKEIDLGFNSYIAKPIYVFLIGGNVVSLLSSTGPPTVK